ncbi:ATP-binding protein [Streptomyces sp. NPDC046977]|uniref:ATP-binding protein n=1 Tax=Streptomyces sp. NPDC046977 TaxID=3154703 RepID=UPI0034068207
MAVGCCYLAWIFDRRASALSDLVDRERAEGQRRATERFARYDALVADTRTYLAGALEQLRRRERPVAVVHPPAAPGDDPLAAALSRLRSDIAEAFAAAGAEHTARLAQAEQAEVFVYIARRLHVLVSRALEALSEAERDVEDPELLHRLFTIDHLVTRTRRAVESLAVLGGETPRRVRKPLLLSTVLRQAVAEIEQYPRVRAVLPGTELALPGYVGPDVIHLLAELVENAARFSPPETQVILRAEQVLAGVVVEVEDRGLAMSPQRLAAMNQLLTMPDAVDMRSQLEAGQTGLLVTARLAQQHGIRVELRTSLLGGTQAVVVLPHALLVAPEEPRTAGARPTEAPVPPTGLPASQRVASPRRSRAAASSATTGQRPPGSGAGRPDLPRRSVAPFAAPAPLPDAVADRPSAPPTTGLMAAFAEGQRGARAAETPERGAPDGPAPRPLYFPTPTETSP